MHALELLRLQALVRHSQLILDVGKTSPILNELIEMLQADIDSIILA